MIFGTIILLLVLAVAYFHYAQGFFSATLSCIFTIIAAVVAVSYHEAVIASLLKGAAANIAQSGMLVVIFIATYVILRTIFDRTIPGNVRYPLLVDKIGAGVVGLVAGLFAGGVLALAAQALPFGPSIAGFSRYTVVDRDVILPGSGSQQDSVTMDEMRDATMDTKNEKSLFIPADELVLGAVNRLSAGALDNGNPLVSVHPDWLTELFGQRVGVQVGAKRVAFNLPGLQGTDLKGVFKMDSVSEIDAEYKNVREGRNSDQQVLAPEKGDTLKPTPDQTLLVVRVQFDASSADDDNKIRFSCAAVRLVGWDDSDGTKTYTDFTPLGTLEDSYVLYRNKADDPLVCQGGKSVDFVFQVPMKDVFTAGDPKDPNRSIKQGVFIEVKRMAQMDLSGKAVTGAPTYDKNVEVMRKPLDQAKRFPKRGPNGETGIQTVAAGPLTITDIKLSSTLFTKVNPGSYQGDKASVDFGSGNGEIINKQFSKLRLETTKTLAELTMGDFATNALYAPPGKKIIQVLAKPAPSAADPWDWVGIVDYTLLDADQNSYRPNGAFAQVNKDGGQPRAVGEFHAEDGNVVGIQHNNDDGRPVAVVLLFVVPEKVEIQQLQYKQQPIKAQTIKVP